MISVLLEPSTRMGSSAERILHGSSGFLTIVMVPLYPAGGQTRRGLKVKRTLWAVKGIFLEWYDIAFNSSSAVKYVPESEDVFSLESEGSF